MSKADTFREKSNELTILQSGLVVDVKKHASALEDCLLASEGLLMGKSYSPRALAIARTKLEEAVMWAVKGITGP